MGAPCPSAAGPYQKDSSFFGLVRGQWQSADVSRQIRDNFTLVCYNPPMSEVQEKRSYQFSLATLLLGITIAALASLAVNLQLKLTRTRAEAARAQEIAAKKAAQQAQLNARLAQQRQIEEMQLRMRGLDKTHSDSDGEQPGRVFRLPHFVRPERAE
jgi:hypothetical protein